MRNQNSLISVDFVLLTDFLKETFIYGSLGSYFCMENFQGNLLKDWFLA